MRSLQIVFGIICVSLNAISALGQEKSKTAENPSACVYCGAPATCRICRTVPEKKKVPTVVFSCEDEDFCIPGRSHCETTTELDENGCYQSSVQTIPTSKEIRTRRILKKSTQENEVTSYKLVVQKVCSACACNLPPLPADGDKAEKLKFEESSKEKEKTEEGNQSKDKDESKSEKPKKESK